MPTAMPTTSPQDRPTLRVIARAGKVSVGTVSLALRDNPLIARETRARIKALAAKMGYRPDPRVAKLMSYLQQHKRRNTGETLAYVTAFAQAEVWMESVTWSNYFAGAQAKAAELGYRVEHFWLRAPGVTERSFSRVMHSRGIQGLLIPPVPHSHSRMAIDWSRFSTVAFGYSLHEPRVNRVVHNHFYTITTALTVLRSRGYERIGLAISPYHDDRVANLWSAGFLTFKTVVDPKHTVPLYRGPIEAKPLLQWFRQHRPDAILSDDLSTVNILGKAGYRVPHDCGFVSLDWHEHTRLFSGIDQHSADLGAAAAKNVIGALQRDEFGVPARPETLMIEGSWVEGASLPVLKGTVPSTDALKATWSDRDTWQ